MHPQNAALGPNTLNIAQAVTVRTHETLVYVNKQEEHQNRVHQHEELYQPAYVGFEKPQVLHRHVDEQVVHEHALVTT